MTSSTTTSTANASLGSSILTSLNAGAGIDTDSLVTKLTAATKAGLQSGIIARQTATAAQISATASIAGDLASFSSSLDTLIAGGTLRSTPKSSDASVATATALAGSRLGKLNASISVTSLAAAQVLRSAAPSGIPASEAGTLTIATAGGRSTAVPIAAGATLADIASAINAAGAGVTASVVSSGGASVLVMKGATGAANGFTVASDGAAALGQFSYGTQQPDGASASAMTATATAVDARLTVDGVAVTSASNTLTNVVSGVELTILKPGDVTLTATRPTDAITSSVNDFVSAYNLLKSELAAATAASTSSTDAGALRGNATVREMERQLGKLTTTPLTAGGKVTTLAQLGVRTAQNGTLSVDGATLADTLSRYPDDVEAMFNPAQTSSSGAVTITSKIGAVAAGTYTLTDLKQAAGGNPAAGRIDGVAASGSGNALSAAAGTAAAGLTLSLDATATLPASATLSVDLGLGGALALVKNALIGTSGAITAFQSRLTKQSSSLADQLAASETRVTVYHDRLVTQFSTMNTRVSAYKATQSYLTQQVDLWTKSSS